MIEQTPLVLILLITKPVFLLLVVWIVIWRSRHQMTSEMLPYSPASKKPEALPTSHTPAAAIHSDEARHQDDPRSPHHLDTQHDGTPN